MSKINKLFSVRKLYNTQMTDELFVKAMAENCRYHYRHCKEYRDILDSFDFTPDQIKTMDDLAKLPFIPTLYFKKHRLLSMPEKRMIVKVSSSGTGGVKSFVGFNVGTLWRAFKMVKRVAKYHKLWSARLTRYVIFGYRPRRENSLGAAKTAYGFTFFAPAASRIYALEWKNGEYSLDLDNIKSKLIKYSKGKMPVRTMGFPAYTYFLLRQMKEEGLSVKLPKGSLICLGGGWKQFYAEKVEKEDFYKLAYEVLGVDDKHIIEFFGAVEHPILYTDCRSHHFHVPAYGRVIIRDVDTLEPVPNGTPGLVNLLTPIFGSMPMLSILTDDIGILHDEPCECGETSPHLEILGRMGIKDIITCAQGAEELLNQFTGGNT
ncbi:MAG: acyl-protein synthetase [Clostridiales bacterium]|nr:acyl-protein synthetase [Clostridiales bacterium]